MPDLVSYRRALATRLGRYALYTTSAAMTGSLAGRRAKATRLMGSSFSSDILDRGFMYVATGTYAGSQVPIAENGLAGATGVLTGAAPFSGADDSGTATAGGASTLTDTSKTWTTNQWATYSVEITAGTGSGQVRTVSSNTATVLTTSSGWGTQPDATSVYAVYIALAASVEVEVHRFLPPLNVLDIGGLHMAINEALRKMWFVDRLPLTPSTANQVEYTLTSYPWLDHRDKIFALYDPVYSATDTPHVSSRPYLLRYDGETPILEITSPFQMGETFWLEVARPGNSRIKPAAGSWTNQTNPLAALTLDGDQAVPPVSHVVDQALIECYRQLRDVRTGDERKAYDKLHDRQVQMVANKKFYGSPMAERHPGGSQGAARRRAGVYQSDMVV